MPSISFYSNMLFILPLIGTFDNGEDGKLKDADCVQIFNIFACGDCFFAAKDYRLAVYTILISFDTIHLYSD